MSIEVDNTRQRIIEAAGEVFARKGFDAATVREICQLGRANLAAINYHFGDKRRLYVEAVKRAHMRRAEQFPLPDWDPGTSAEKKLADFILTLLRRVISPAGTEWEGALLMREIGSPTSACRELVSDSIRPHFEMLNAILQELAPTLSPEKRRLTAFSVVGQCLYYRVAAPVVELLLEQDEYAHYQPELLADHITEFTLRGMGAR
jgi:AcrR family transcriptional regulator